MPCGKRDKQSEDIGILKHKFDRDDVDDMFSVAFEITNFTWYKIIKVSDFISF